MIRLPRSVLPVLDLRQGQVVHARAGQRACYQPLVSRWTTDASHPLRLTSALTSLSGCNEFYLADLDAIEGTGTHHEVVQQLISSGYQLWLDAGVTRLEEIDSWLSLGIHRIILASESILSLTILTQAIENGWSSQLVFSLDLFQGKARSLPGTWGTEDPLIILSTAHQLGISQFIILDTAAVGTSQGCPTLPLCQAFRRESPEASIITGGGVRSWQDIALLEQHGIDRILLSTLLHDARSPLPPHSMGDNLPPSLL